MLFRLSRIMLPALFVVTAFITTLTHAIETNDSLMAKGEWKDPKTGLIWMRCSIGQRWDGSTCYDNPQKFTWNDAKNAIDDFNKNGGFGGDTNWRLPNIEELNSIIKCSSGWQYEITRSGQSKSKALKKTELGLAESCAEGSIKPTLDPSIFPNTPVDFYWSATPYAGNSSGVWYVYFNFGFTDASGKTFSYYVRAVRTDP